MVEEPRGKRPRLESRCNELLATDCNLDRKNPRAKEDITHLPPEQLAQTS